MRLRRSLFRSVFGAQSQSPGKYANKGNGQGDDSQTVDGVVQWMLSTRLRLSLVHHFLLWKDVETVV